jgi:hypothetical protein
LIPSYRRFKGEHIPQGAAYSGTHSNYVTVSLADTLIHQVNEAREYQDILHYGFYASPKPSQMTRHHDGHPDGHPNIYN